MKTHCFKLKSSCWFPVFGSMVVSILVLLVVTGSGVDAKRGCANFGHSCYGGMGKRTDIGITDEISPSLIGEQEINGPLQQQVQENPAFVFTGPRSEYRPPPQIGKIDLNQLPPYLRFWMRSWRNMKNGPDYV